MTLLGQDKDDFNPEQTPATSLGSLWFSDSLGTWEPPKGQLGWCNVVLLSGPAGTVFVRRAVLRYLHHSHLSKGEEQCRMWLRACDWPLCLETAEKHERRSDCPHWMGAGDGAGILCQARLISSVTDNKKTEPKSREKVHADQLHLLVPWLWHYGETGGGRSLSSSFSGYTSDTLFFLAKIWLISMNDLPLVSGMTRKM